MMIVLQSLCCIWSIRWSANFLHYILGSLIMGLDKRYLSHSVTAYFNFFKSAMLVTGIYSFCAFFYKNQTCSQIQSFWLGGKSWFRLRVVIRPARLHRLAGRFDNPMLESTISPIQGLLFWPLDYVSSRCCIKKNSARWNYFSLWASLGPFFSASIFYSFK
jgi:hypothetical protein